MTVSDLIKRSLQDLQLTDGDTPDPNDVALAFDRLNDFIDDLKNDGLLVFTVTRTTWALVSGTASYTIGTGATINVDRPVSPDDIQNIGYVDTSLTPPAEYLQGPCLTEDQFAAIPFKTLTATIPARWYYNPTFGASGFGTLKPFPIPTSSVLNGVIYTPSSVSEFAALGDTILLPPGFRRFFRNQLIVEIAGAFEKADAAAVARAEKNATDSKAKIKRTNERLLDRTFDVALVSGRPSNVYTGN